MNLTCCEDLRNRKKFLKNPNDLTTLAKLIDHTLLKIDAKNSNFLDLFAEANQFGFRSVCVPPSLIKLAKQHCKDVLVCTVIGFPNGYNTIESKVFEVKDALFKGTDEIDFVHNVNFVKSKEWDLLKTEYSQIVKSSQACTTKLILETSLLSEAELIKCIELAVDAGVNMIKTSTGFGQRGASVEDISLIQKTLDTILGKNNTVGIKASGGVRTDKDALKMIKLGATRIGTSNGVAMVSA